MPRRQAKNSKRALLRTALRQFAAQRAWDLFHFPKNLAIVLSVDASELLA